MLFILITLISISYWYQYVPYPLLLHWNVLAYCLVGVYAVAAALHGCACVGLIQSAQDCLMAMATKQPSAPEGTIAGELPMGNSRWGIGYTYIYICILICLYIC